MWDLILSANASKHCLMTMLYKFATNQYMHLFVHCVSSILISIIPVQLGHLAPLDWHDAVSIVRHGCVIASAKTPVFFL